MAAREFLWIVKESAFGTPKVTPTAGTDSIYIRLDGGNAFSMRAKPKQKDVMYGGGRAIKALKVSGESEVMGTLKTNLCYSQAQLLLDWWLTPINSGQTAPWTTTELAGDLASCSIYHAFQRSTGLYVRKHYKGVKVARGSLEASRESVVVPLSFDLRGKSVDGNSYDASADPDATAFPAPDEDEYPTDLVLFQHSSAGLKIANSGTARSSYESFGLDVANKLDARACESRWLQYLRCQGREAQLKAKLILKPSPDDRASYAANTVQTGVSLVLTNTTNTITLDFESTNYLSDVSDELSLENIYEQGLTVDNLFDVTAATDLSFTFA